MIAVANMPALKPQNLVVTLSVTAYATLNEIQRG